MIWSIVQKKNGAKFRIVQYSNTKIIIENIICKKRKVEEDHGEDKPFLDYFFEKYKLIESK